MSPGSPPASRAPALVWLFTGASVALPAAVFVAAALAPAPAVVLPLIVLVCLAAPMHAAWRLAESRAKGAERSEPADDAMAPSGGAADRRALLELRRFLDQLPETRHPLED